MHRSWWVLELSDEGREVVVNGPLHDALARLREKVVPDDCVVYMCVDCRDTGYMDSPDPRGRPGSVLVRDCPRCGNLTLSERRQRWRRCDEETVRNVREWRTRL